MQQEIFLKDLCCIGFLLFLIDRPRVSRATERALIEMTLRNLRTSPRPAVSRTPAHDALPTEARSAQRVLARL